MNLSNYQKEIDGLLAVFANRIYSKAFSLIQSDPHQWSTRPCNTCQTVTTIIGKPFGCDLYALQERQRNKGPR